MKTICDKCENYCVSPSGVSETCHAQKKWNYTVIAFLTDDYVNQRMNGEKNHCKAFEKVFNNYQFYMK